MRFEQCSAQVRCIWRVCNWGILGFSCLTTALQFVAHTDWLSSAGSFHTNVVVPTDPPTAYRKIATGPASFKVARNEVENTSFAQRSAHRNSRIWRLELIEPAAERKRRARGRRPTSKSAYPDPQILPQCNI